jgi:hypothetical protein
MVLADAAEIVGCAHGANRQPGCLAGAPTWRIHLRSVSAVIPSRRATELIAAYSAG